MSKRKLTPHTLAHARLKSPSSPPSMPSLARASLLPAGAPPSSSRTFLHSGRRIDWASLTRLLTAESTVCAMHGRSRSSYSPRCRQHGNRHWQIQQQRRVDKYSKAAPGEQVDRTSVRCERPNAKKQRKKLRHQPTHAQHRKHRPCTVRFVSSIYAVGRRPFFLLSSPHTQGVGEGCHRLGMRMTSPSKTNAPRSCSAVIVFVTSAVSKSSCLSGGTAAFK